MTDIHATLGDGDDTISVGRWTFMPSILDGGPGADSLTGGPYNDRLIGGPGPDELNGGVNGVDTADYSARTNNLGIYADNGIADDGEYGEGDNVRWDVENIIGGSAATSCGATCATTSWRAVPATTSSRASRAMTS